MHTFSDTRAEAYAASRRTTQTVRVAALALLERHGPLTADEAAQYLGLSVLSTRPTFTNLKSERLIVDTGLRRKSALGRNTAVCRLAVDGV